VKQLRVVIAFALTAAAVRLLPLHFLHPLNWDELEFFRATSWIAEGRMPYRDFWEHHTPLVWFLFAPFTLLTKSPGIDAILLLRWLQIPAWIATFWLTDAWMRNAGIERFARWSAMAIALASSMFMIAAVEYRVEAIACALLMGGLVLAQRERYALAGVAFCLVGFANLRMGPVLVVAVVALLVARRMRSWPLVIGGTVTLIALLAGCYANGMLEPLVRHVWFDNLAEKHVTPIVGVFAYRLLSTFGLRIMGTDRLFDLAAVDVGGICVLLLGVVGIVAAFRRRDSLLLIALLQLTNLWFIASMKFIFNYHLLLAVILMIPLMAAAVERVSRREAMVAVVAVAWCVNLFASVFRGKELDRAYQDLIMRETHARTAPGDRVLSGIPWALRREPAYRMWFLPELARVLVQRGEAPRYVVDEPPAAVVFDHNLLRWVALVQRDLAPYLVRHYIPLWRELWIPAMNASVRPGGSVTWSVPRDGHYRVHAFASLARHPWFRDPLRVAIYDQPDASRLTVTLPPPHAGAMRFDADVTRLRKGQRLTATNTASEDVAVILLPTDDRTLFRQPPHGAKFEAESWRVTHVPRIGVRIQP
jgi:hypothetical protein